MTINIKNLPTSSQVAILGFGKEGQSSYRFLQEQGYDNISIIDQKLSAEEIQNILLGIKGNNEEVEIFVGDAALSGLETADIIIKSPGVSPFQAELAPYRDKYISQTEIFFSFYTGKVIGITGTKGKSTISTLTYEFLKKAGYQVKLVGNIGSPVLDEITLGDEEKYDYVIYELSSYMLQDFSPQLFIGFLNNIYPCHLDWHNDDYNIYREAKVNIIRNAQIQIIHGNFSTDVGETSTQKGQYLFATDGNFTVQGDDIYFRDTLFLEREEITLQGKHNLENICGVLEIVSHIIDDPEQLKQISKDFFPQVGGLPHRIEHIGTYNGINFINDAIATTPESTIAAIETFDGKLQTLFVGGEDSGFDFLHLRDRIVGSSITHIVAFPDTSEIIFPEIQPFPYDTPFTVKIENKEVTFLKTRSMTDAVQFAYDVTLSDRVSLLSSAAPSFSVWNNYIEKAQQFRDAVEEIGSKTDI